MKTLFRYCVLYSLLNLVAICSFGQIASQDALELKKLLVGGKWQTDDPKVVEILRRYLNTDETISSQFKTKNKFTEDFFPSTWTKGSEGPLLSFLSSAGNLDVTNLADGFA